MKRLLSILLFFVLTCLVNAQQTVRKNDLPEHYRYQNNAESFETRKEFKLSFYRFDSGHTMMAIDYGIEPAGLSQEDERTISITAHSLNGGGIAWFQHELFGLFDEHRKFVCFHGDTYPRKVGISKFTAKLLSGNSYGFYSDGLFNKIDSQSKPAYGALENVFKALDRILNEWRNGKTDFLDELQNVESYIFLINHYPDQHRIK